MGKLDNTLIIYISGDNGNSAEGSILGTPTDMAAIQGVNVPVPEQLKFYDVWGSAQTTPHMAVAWTWAFDTPFKWTKQVASHFGGTGRARPSHGPVTSTTLAAFARSSTTSSISCRRSLKRLAFKRRSWSMA
jgi:hypothetical protein